MVKSYVDSYIKIKHYFSYIFSSVSDFGIKETHEFYKPVCDILNVNPSEMVHVAADWEFNFIAPRSIGINAFYLDMKRSNKDKNDFIINSRDSIFLNLPR